MKKHQFVDQYPMPKRIVLQTNNESMTTNKVPNQDLDLSILMQQRQLDWCYNSYLQDPVHQKMVAHCQDYYATLKSLAKSQNELKQLAYTARRYAKEDAWHDTMQPTEYKLYDDDFFGTKRGLRLAKFGFYTMYNFYEHKAHKLASLYEYFGIKEIRLFLSQHKLLLQDFNYRENETAIRAIYQELSEELQEEIELTKWELSQSEQELEACRKERDQLYRRFFTTYTQLVADNSSIVAP